MRQLHIDVLKVIGAQLIVLHHFAAYGPLADTAARLTPALSNWLYDYARMAVQIFLVLGGYLAAQQLASSIRADAGTLARVAWRRYLRLALPLMVALAVAMASAAIARPWLPLEFIPSAPGWGQTLAHVLLLHGVLGSETLSAGVWYIAIDFQLYVLLALALWLGQPVRLRVPALLLIIGLMLVSLLHFNRDARWDNWALYFFGSYALGVLAWWAHRARHPPLWLALLALVGVVALLLEYRTRIALALTVALMLALVPWRRLAERSSPSLWWLAQVLQAQSRSSYALFLMHFPVLMLGNALYARHGASSDIVAVWMLLGSWLACIGLAYGFERWVEAPLTRWALTGSSESTMAAASPRSASRG